MPLELSELPYSYESLAPYMSAETLKYHHDKHHKAYVDKANKLFDGIPHLGDTLEEVVINAHKGGHMALFNNAGQHWNHTFFWSCMKPKGGGKIPANLEKAIQDSFGSFEAFRDEFIAAGLGQFGSGWCWLVAEKNGKLAVTKTPNAENPLISDQVPLLTCDVWEHSYYIDYRNERAKFLETFIDKLVNWENAAGLLERAG